MTEKEIINEITNLEHAFETIKSRLDHSAGLDEFTLRTLLKTLTLSTHLMLGLLVELFNDKYKQ